MRVTKAEECAATLDQHLANTLVARTVEHRCAKIAVRVGRVHAQLANLVAILTRNRDWPDALDRKPLLLEGVGHEAMQQPARQTNVVVLPKAQIAELSLEQATA